MKLIIFVVSCLTAVTLAKPGIQFLSTPIIYAQLQSGAPIGLDGKVIDTPEVALAKAEHAAAYINERLNLVSAKSRIVLPLKAESLNGGAPIGIDGRVVDTPEVALAKAEHTAAHLNEQLINSSDNENSNVISYKLAKVQSGAPIGIDGRVIDTPEVALAKAEHAAAHINARLAKPIKYSAIPTAYSTYIASSPIVQYYI